MNEDEVEIVLVGVRMYNFEGLAFLFRWNGGDGEGGRGGSFIPKPKVYEKQTVESRYYSSFSIFSMDTFVSLILCLICIRI